MKKLFLFLLLSNVVVASALADVPTPNEDCLMDRCSLCRFPQGSFTRTEGPCPKGTETLKPYEPNKICPNPAQLEKNADLTRKPVVSASPQVPKEAVRDMARLSWKDYAPFAIFLGVILLILFFSIRAQLKKGRGLVFILVKLGASTTGALVAGLFVGHFVMQEVSRRVGSEGMIGGLAGLAAGMLSFAIVGLIVGAIINSLIDR